MRINERWAPTRHTLQHKVFSSYSWRWRHSQHELPANMKQERRKRGGKFTLDLPLHNKAEDKAGKWCHFRWPGVLRCRALSFLLREKRTPKPLSGIYPPTLPCVLLPLCSSYYTGGLIFTSNLFPVLIWSTICCPPHCIPTCFDFLRKEVERQFWKGKFGPGSRAVLLGGVWSPFDCREEVKWGWTEDVGAVLIRKDKTRQVGRVI